MSKQSLDKEILIRGRTLQIFSDIEILLAQLLLYSNEMDSIEKMPIHFKGLTIGKKINAAFDSLKKFRPLLFNKLLLDDLRKLSIFRNQIAHNGFSWDENDLSFFFVWDISETEDKIQYYSPIKYTLKEFFEKIEEMKIAGIRLAEIVMEIKQDFDKKFPNFFNSPSEIL